MVSQQTIFYLLYLEGLYPVIAIKIFLVSHKNGIFYHVILLAHCSVTESWYFQTTFPKLSNPMHSYNPAFHSFFLVNCKSQGRRNSHIKVTGMPVRKWKLNPYGRPMWVWLQLRLTPKADYTKTYITSIFVLNVQLPEISDTRMGKYSDFLSQTRY